MVQLLSMNSLQRKGVLAVQVTGKTFERIGGPVKMMMSVIAAMLPTVKFLRCIWIFYIAFDFHKNTLK